MDRMFSVDDMAGHFWSPSPAGDNGAGDEDESSSSSSASKKNNNNKSTMMNRSMSEWAFQRFIQETSSQPPESSSSKDKNGNDHASAVVVDIKDQDETKDNKSTTTAATATTPFVAGAPNVPIDSEEYQDYLKSRLNLACAAVALTRASSVKPQDFAALPDNGSHASNTLQLGYQASSTHTRATSDDSSDAFLAPPTLPATTPVTTPTIVGTHHLFAETSSRLLMRRTPGKRVRNLSRGPLAPRGQESTAEIETIYEEPPQRRLRPAHLDWMPHLLREWRALEGIPSTYETGGCTSSPMPLTDEPLELTVPTLVAVIRTLFMISYNRGEDIRELQSDTSRLDRDMASTYERLGLLESHRSLNREIAETARARVEVLERRVRIVEFVVGVCVMMTVFWTTVGMCFPYFL